MSEIKDLYKELDALTCDEEIQSKSFNRIKQVCHEIVVALTGKSTDLSSRKNQNAKDK